MATFERRCPGCGKWSTVEVKGSIVSTTTVCPFCRASYGPIGIGDKLVKGEPMELVNPKNVGRKGPVAPAEEPKLPEPMPGEEGYVAPSPKRGAS